MLELKKLVLLKVSIISKLVLYLKISIEKVSIIKS